MYVNVLAMMQEIETECSYAEYVCDYYDSNSYICDTITRIADDNTSIYYSDIIKYISEHVTEVNDAICEFGWDGCGNDLYKAGQTAEYMQIEREMYDNFADLVQLYALNHIRREYGYEEISEDLWYEIVGNLEIDNNDTWDTIREIVNTTIADYNAETNEETAEDAETVTA